MYAFYNRFGNERGYLGLIALLAVVAIIIVVYAFVISPNMGSREDRTRQQAGEMGVKLDENKSLPGAAMDKGKETACRSQLDQIRQAIVMYKAENESGPSSLQDLRMSVGQHFFRCPLGNEPYVLEPATSAVRCVHPGHEGL